MWHSTTVSHGDGQPAVFLNALPRRPVWPRTLEVKSRAERCHMSGREVSGRVKVYISSDGCGNPQGRAYRRDSGALHSHDAVSKIDCLLTMRERLT